MIVTNLSNHVVASKVMRHRLTAGGQPYGTWTTTSYPNVGCYQQVTGYRGERLSPEWRSLHPVTMLKWEGTSMFTPLRAIPVGSQLYGHSGNIAASCFNKNGMQYYNKAWASDDYRKYTPEAILEGLAAVKSPTFDGSTNLGELKETLSMIRNPLLGIRRLGKELIKGYRRGGGLRLLDYLSSQWLEYRYGIMPLVGTVSDLLSTVDKKLTNGYIIYKGRAGKRYVLSDDTTIVSGLADAFPIKYYAEKRVVREVRTGAVYWAKLNDTASRKWGLRASDIPSTMWELIPYSFMVDWVFNVGDYIRAITPNRDIKILSCAISAASKRSTSHILTKLEYDNCAYPSLAGRCDVVESFLQRSTSYTVPAWPILNRNILNWKRSLDLLSIGVIPRIQKIFKNR